MKIIISEEQFDSLYEQDTGFTRYLDRAHSTYQSAEKTNQDFKNLDPHTFLTIAAIGSALIPLVGPFISAGIGLADAAIYYKQGDTKTAGLVALFSFIPLGGMLANKLGLSKWTAEALGNIGKKISSGAKLTNTEVQVANRVAKYKDLITAEMKKMGEKATLSTAKKTVKKQLAVAGAKKAAKTTAKTLGAYGAAGYGYSKGYDYAQKDTPKTKAETSGQNWESVKSAFGSSGSEEDNKLLNAAWDKGWRPGQVVPQQFQTKVYQQNYSQETENIKMLQDLITQNK